MPFISDMIADNENKRKDIEALNAENLSDEDVRALHASSKSDMNSRFKFDINTVMSSMRKEIIGQEEALDSVEDMLKVVRADITDPRRPLYTALFLGPTGVGKTEIVRSLSRTLYGDADSFCRIDMNTLSQEHYAASLTGAPPGYVGAKEGTTIIDEEKLEGQPGLPAIVLLDELEKASKQVLNALLNVFDNGMLTVASGEKTYSFRNAIIFMTSNLAAQEIMQYEERQKKFSVKMFAKKSSIKKIEIENIVKSKMLDAFSPEFVNRIDNITIFNWIETNAVARIVELEVEKLNRRLMKHNCKVSIDEHLLSTIIDSGFDKQFGARSLRRAVRRYLEVPLAEYLLDYHRVGPDDQAVIKYEATLDKGDVVFNPVRSCYGD